MNLVKFWLAFFPLLGQNKELGGPKTNQLAIFAAYLFFSLSFKKFTHVGHKKRLRQMI
jgi:hypothetical protein